MDLELEIGGAEWEDEDEDVDDEEDEDPEDEEGVFGESEQDQALILAARLRALDTPEYFPIHEDDLAHIFAYVAANADVEANVGFGFPFGSDDEEEEEEYGGDDDDDDELPALEGWARDADEDVADELD